MWGLVLVHSVFGMPMCTVMMRGYYADVPDALIRQAMIDGNGMWQIYRKIVVPNTKIATITDVCVPVHLHLERDALCPGAGRL